MDKIRLVIKIITVRRKRLKRIKGILRIIIEMKEEGEWVSVNQKTIEWAGLNETGRVVCIGFVNL